MPVETVPSSGSVPSATPTTPGSLDESASAAEIVLEASGFAILADDGAALFEYTWADEGYLAVEALESVFGTSGEQSLRPGDGGHFPDYTVYTWDGLSFLDEQNLEKPRDEYPQPSFMEFSSDQARGILLRTADGIRVGDTAESVRERGPATSWYIDGYGGRYLFDVDDPDAALAGEPAGASVMAESDVEDGLIVQIRAFFDSGL